MLLVDRDACVRSFTPAAGALMRLAPAAVGRCLGDIPQRFPDPLLLSDVRLAIEAGTRSSREVQTSSGRWYVRQTLPCNSPNGTIEGAVVILSDIAAEMLREARTRAEAVVDTVTVPVALLDDDLRVVSVNKAFSELFQVGSDTVSGRKFCGETSGAFANDAHLLRLLKTVARAGHPLRDYEVRYTPVERAPRALLLNARPLDRSGGRAAARIVVVLDDVTERRRVQEALRETELRYLEKEQVRQRHVELSKAQRLSTVGELASGLAHELNQPLASISNVVGACARYVQAGTFNRPKLLELLSDAAAEAMRAASIIAQLRSCVDKAGPRFRPVALGQLVANVPHLLTGELERSRISLRVDPADERMIVSADKVQIEQVIVNLIQNAIDSIEEANGPDRLIVLSARRAHGMGQVSIRDTGKGVSTQAADRMFEAFFTTKEHGLGMGLALSRSILETHRGRIWMERPQDGEPGVIVRFALPLIRPKQRRNDGMS